MITTVPPPPAGLGEAGRDLWDAMHGFRELDWADRVLLKRACRQLERVIDLTERLPESADACSAESAVLMRLMKALRAPGTEDD